MWLVIAQARSPGGLVVQICESTLKAVGTTSMSSLTRIKHVKENGLKLTEWFWGTTIPGIRDKGRALSEVDSVMTAV